MSISLYTWTCLHVYIFNVKYVFSTVNFKGIKPHVRYENSRSNVSNDAQDLPQLYQYIGILLYRLQLERTLKV